MKWRASRLSAHCLKCGDEAASSPVPSAGAAVMSARMITGEERGLATEDERFRSIQAGRIATTNGFGFLTNAIVDQHFIARKRSNRLFSAVLEQPQLLGIGIDESTAVIVGPDQRCEVVG